VIHQHTASGHPGSWSCSQLGPWRQTFGTRLSIFSSDSSCLLDELGEGWEFESTAETVA
jgi:hypothetical protein